MAEATQSDPTETTPLNGTTDGEGAGADDHEAQIAALNDEVARLKTTNGQLLNDKGKRKKADESSAALTASLKQWNDLAEEFDLEPDTLRDQLTEAADQDHQKARDKGEIDKVLANNTKTWQRKLDKSTATVAERDAEIERRGAIIERLTIDQQLLAELAEHVDPDPGLRKGAYAIHRPNLKLLEDDEATDGLRVVYMVAGEPVPLPQAIKRWIEEDQESYPYHPKNRSSGGGAPPGKSGGKSFGHLKRSAMSPLDKSNFIETHGAERYNALPV